TSYYGPEAKDAIPALLKLLPSHETFGSATTKAWMEIGPAALPGLLRALKSPDRDTRAGAVYAISLQFPRPTSAVPALIRAFRDPDEVIRSCIVLTLKYIGDPRAIPFLIDVARTDPNRQVHINAVEALGRFGPAAREAVPVLLAGLKGPPPIDHAPSF